MCCNAILDWCDWSTVWSSLEWLPDDLKAVLKSEARYLRRVESDYDSDSDCFSSEDEDSDYYSDV